MPFDARRLIVRLLAFSTDIILLSDDQYEASGDTGFTTREQGRTSDYVERKQMLYVRFAKPPTPTLPKQHVSLGYKRGEIGAKSIRYSLECLV